MQLKDYLNTWLINEQSDVYRRYMKTVETINEVRRAAIISAYTARIEQRFQLGKLGFRDVDGYEDEMGDDVSDLPGARGRAEV